MKLQDYYTNIGYLGDSVYMRYYLIRHKATGEFMPQMKKDRGYSHWNPGNSIAEKPYSALPIPRLIDTRKRAARIIVQWNALPNAHSDFDGDTQISLDNRKKDDLEIVEVDIVEIANG